MLSHTTNRLVTCCLDYSRSLFQIASGRSGVRVFNYHGVVERKTDAELERNFHLLSDFREHLRFLKRVRLLSLPELVEEIAAPAGWRKPAAVITFDDGYANNLLACQMLAENGLSGAVFVSTGALERGGAIWTVELSLLLLHGQAEQIEALGRPWPLGNRDERLDSFRAIRRQLKAMPAGPRRAAQDAIWRQFPDGETQRLLQAYPSLQMMDWSEVHQLAGAGIEIGSHGVTHEIHHDDQPEAVRWSELTDSKSVLEQKLSCPCRYFAFPNGNVTKNSPAEVAAAGYELAFTTQPGAVRPGANRYLLPRLTPHGALRRFVHDFHR